MWFKNLQVYRLPAAWAAEPADIDAMLSRHPLQPCGSFDMESRGWVPPRPAGPLLHRVGGHWLIALGTDLRLLPAAVVNQVVKERAAEMAAQQGYPVGRKQLRDLRDRVVEELLPRAFTHRRVTWAWIDPANGWLAIDAAGKSRAEELIETLLKSVDDVRLRRLDTLRSPAAAMTQWVAEGEAPAGFTLDQDLELQSAQEDRATVRYVRHNLDGKEIQDHIADGKTAMRLGMTWNDRISFVLDAELQVKRLAFLDILKEQAEGQAADDDERFDIDFALMAGELSRLLADLTQALGGEKVPQV